MVKIKDSIIVFFKNLGNKLKSNSTQTGEESHEITPESIRAQQKFNRPRHPEGKYEESNKKQQKN